MISGVVTVAGCKQIHIKSLSPVVDPPSDVTLKDARLDELSGIAASVSNPGWLYVHNDSGDSSRWFALSPDGGLKATIHYDADPHLGLGVTDVEDIAVCTGPEAGAHYVYLADIGDNNAVRKYITIYRVKDPVLTTPYVKVHADHLVLRYPDGPRDAETLMADPVDKLLYIVSKREDSVGVYSTPLNFQAGDTVVLTKRAKLFFAGSGEPKWVTAGDISPSGAKILLKSYAHVYYWKRAAGEPVWKAMQRAAANLSYDLEPQGEAIGFSLDEKGYYTVSEGSQAKLYRYSTPN
jgi:hypothetical protein